MVRMFHVKHSFEGTDVSRETLPLRIVRHAPRSPCAFCATRHAESALHMMLHAGTARGLRVRCLAIGNARILASLADFDNARIPATLADFGLACRSRLRSQLCFVIDFRCSSAALFCVPLPALSPFRKILRNAFRRIAQRKSHAAENRETQMKSRNAFRQTAQRESQAAEDTYSRKEIAERVSQIPAVEVTQPKTRDRKQAAENA